MSDRVHNIEKAVEALSPAEFKEFAGWFMDYGQTGWEKEIEADAKPGRLDILLEEAKAEKSVRKLKEF